MAADLCQAKGIEYVFLDYLDWDKSFLDEYKEFYSHPTVPIILQNNLESGIVTKVGGYTELLQLTKKEI